MTQNPILRPFQPEQSEYEAIVRVYNQAKNVYLGSVSTWQHWDKHRDPARLFTRYVAEQQGEIVGYGFSTRTDPAANIFRFAIYYLPDWESPELIHHFYSYLMELCVDLGAAGLLCGIREDEPEKIAWAKQQGFQMAMRYPTSTLKLAGFKPSDYIELHAKIGDSGLEIVSLERQAHRDPEWQRKVYDLENLLNEDVPRPSGFSPPPFDKYIETEFKSPEFIPALWLVALDGESYVGMTSLWKSGDGIDMLETGLTGVRREYRRRGLAMALKSQALEQAQSLGACLVLTSNEENNPMYHLNLKLGFQAQPADLDWKKKLEDSEKASIGLG